MYINIYIYKPILVIPHLWKPPQHVFSSVSRDAGWCTTWIPSSVDVPHLASGPRMS